MNDECGRLLIKTSDAPMAIITSTARYEGMNARVERTRIAMPRGRVTAILFKRIP